ncbi:MULTISPECIES: aminotransferase class V-fold PLP-dependent enzyme [Mannheimia]|uniref:cysteine desulfurase n=1 Tax=Mannheimia pernigra TaxID=111844 RepID=A0A7D5DWR2_9PAST|nr:MULTISPECIES: cysteine desulfurase [Mannheimia]QLB41001.1 aminotransferase class V-fold PLP-dependent enzyme [Mannheimia pernigra]QLB42940.1 aminotransferase class V-fold PLP-dependent enzyme [Mannheimia pernigra]QTM01644.1 aminotransferase class V-fold PLP-dependent enzyme [Mannheimia sp. ZY171111]
MPNALFRTHFPFFEKSDGWTYLDSAATTLKPNVLIQATSEFYSSAGSVHRSQYDLPQTEQYELARDLVAKRFNVETCEAVIWTSGTTQSINIVAYGLEHRIKQGDEIVISVAEHHANFIPWQQLAERTRAKLIVLPLNDKYQIEPEALKNALSKKTKIVAFNLVSNVTGVRQAAEQLIPMIRQYSSAKVMLDIAQAVCCEQVDVQKLGADFYAFSAHKMYGPNGVGVLTGKLQSLEQIRPLVFGGKMLKNITEDELIVADLPYRLEAGTPNIAGIIGFGQVLAWLQNFDLSRLNNPLYALAEYTRKRLNSYQNVQIIGQQNTPTISFIIENQHPADIAAFLTQRRIAIRQGEHCAKPYLRYLQESGTLRLSLAHYNTKEDIEHFFNALDLALEILQ